MRTSFSAPLTGLRSGSIWAEPAPGTSMRDSFPAIVRFTVARSTAVGSSKVELKIVKYSWPASPRQIVRSASNCSSLSQSTYA